MRFKPLWWTKWIVLVPTVLLALAYLLDVPMDFITAGRDSPIVSVTLFALAYVFVAMLAGGTAHVYRLFWSLVGFVALGLLELTLLETSPFGDVIRSSMGYRWAGVVLAILIGAPIWSNIQYKRHLALIEDGKLPLSDPLAHHPRLKRRLQAMRKRVSDEGTKRKPTNAEKKGLLRALYDTCRCHGSMMQMIFGGVRDLIKLVELGADVNGVVPDTHGQTPLMGLHKRRCALKAAILLETGADPNARDHYGRTPFMHAAETYPDVTQVLLAAGADANAQDKQGMTALMYHAWHHSKRNLTVGDRRIWRKVLFRATNDIDTQDESGDTAAMWAVKQDDEEVVRDLFITGANPLIKNHEKKTPLKEAMEWGKEDVAKVSARAEALWRHAHRKKR